MLTDSNPPTNASKQNTHEPEIDKPTPFKDWDTLHHDLAHTPEVAELLDTYGKPAWESLEHDLHRHPYLEARNTFNQAYNYALWHRTLTAARDDNTLTNYTYKDLEHITGIPWGRIRDWELEVKSPHLERTLRIHEAARQHWETQLPHEAKDHLLDPSFVYNTLKPLLDHPDHQTTENLASTIETLYHHGSTQRLTIAELKPYHRTGPQDLRTIAHTIIAHRTVLEDLLNQRLNLTESQEELRIAIDHDTLYLWRKTTNPDHWPNAYKNELLYLTPDFKETLVKTTQQHLNVNKQELGQLIDQLTDQTRERTYNPRAIPYELYPTKWSKSLYGETLHFLTDATNQSFTTIKPHITQIARISNLKRGGGIHNPHFPEGKQLHELRARILAIALSDCHITHGYNVTYHENNATRLTYVQNLFHKLGDCTYQLNSREGRRTRLTVTTPVGRLLEYWGVPRGDKHLHPNLRLPETIRNGTHNVKCAYIAEVIPEDGFFVERNGKMKFGIKRAQVLKAGKKAKMYNFQSLITNEHVEFIQQYGRKHSRTIRGDTSRREITLSKGRLESLKTEAKNTPDRDIAAHLEKIVYENPCRLLEDEKELIESLDIQMTRIFKMLILYESERVSTIWEIYTETEDDTRKWANIAPPASGPKQEKVQTWLHFQEECLSSNS